MKKSVITLIAAASLALPVVALAHQGVATPMKTVANVHQEDRGVQAQPGDNHGQVQGVAHDANDIDINDVNGVNDNDANENQAEEASEDTPMPAATPVSTPSPAVTPAVEDRMNAAEEAGDNDATGVHSSGRDANSGHDGSND